MSDSDLGTPLESLENEASPFQSEPRTVVGETDIAPIGQVQRQSDQTPTTPMPADYVQRNADAGQTPNQQPASAHSEPIADSFQQPFDRGNQAPDVQPAAEGYMPPEAPLAGDVPVEPNWDASSATSDIEDVYLQRAPDDDATAADDSNLVDALSHLGVLRHASNREMPPPPKHSAPKSSALTTHTPEPPSPSAPPVQRSEGVRIEGYTTPPPATPPPPPRAVMREEDEEVGDIAEDINVEQLAKDVYRRLRDRLRIERERRHR
jgi:hypothetical protein